MTKLRSETKRWQFTEGRIASLRKPERETKLYDRQVKDLGLRLWPNGRKVYFWFRSVPEEEQPERPGKPTWKTIGESPAITLAAARAKAEEYNSLLANWKKDGCHRPSPFKVSTGERTLGELTEDFYARHLRAHAQRPEIAERDARWRFDKHLAHWKDRRLSTISQQDVQELHEKIGKTSGRYAANSIAEFVCRVFNFAVKTELFRGSNPAANIKRFHEEKRKRFLQRDELPRLFAALATEKNVDLVDFVKLALWTGARKSDVLSMRWQDLALDDNRWTVPNPKGGESYTVALTAEAVAILRKRAQVITDDLRSPWIFPSNSRSGHLTDLTQSWNPLLERAAITDFRIHDLRRTLASWQALQGTSLLVIGKSLGHRSVSATAIYAQLSLDPVRESVNSATQALVKASKL